MTYSCIDAYEGILADLAEIDPALEASLQTEDAEDAAQVATWASATIQKLNSDRRVLLAALRELKEWGNMMGGWEAQAWTTADAAIAQATKASGDCRPLNP